jgi:hypothetical protein
MNGHKAALLLASTLAAMALVAWAGYTWRNEVAAFLRALVRAL